jgi:opacity protein-like surface antigen
MVLLLAAAQPAIADGIGTPGKWSGGYLGVTTDGIWTNRPGGSSAAAWSAYAGYGLQLNNLVVGVEGDATWGGASSSTAISPLIYWTDQIKWSATLRGRLGIGVGDVLVYGTGGLAYLEETKVLNRLGQLISETTATPGLAVGAGVEYRLMSGISIRLEALRYNYTILSQSIAADPLKSLPALTRPDLSAQDTTVRAGISLRLN